MPTPLDQLTATAARLRTVAESLTADQLRAPAYPSEWTIADTLSHLGSAAVINRQRVEDALAGREPDDGFAPSVWADWDTRSPEDQATGYVAATANLLALVTGLTEEQRAPLSISMGPVAFDADTFVGLLLNEHVLHAWDVEVALDPTTALSEAATEHVLGQLPMIAGWAGKASADGGRVEVRTHAPERRLSLTLGPERVAIEPSPDGDRPDLTLPAEAFVRLVYGRLDDAHTPEEVAGTADLDRLRAVFPGL